MSCNSALDTTRISLECKESAAALQWPHLVTKKTMSVEFGVPSALPSLEIVSLPQDSTIFLW